jgi:hypothetical protein
MYAYCTSTQERVMAEVPLYARHYAFTYKPRRREPLVVDVELI